MIRSSVGILLFIIINKSASLPDKPLHTLLPHQRDIGMGFQNYALFPYMTVAENLTFPLTIRRMSKADVKERVSCALV